MTTLKSDFLKIMTERGFMHQCSDLEGLDKLAADKRVVAYVGYDCTAPSLHVGSLLSIMMLSWLQKCGGKPIALMGGGTTRVGDPSGKDETRQLRSIDEIEKNKNGMKQVFAKFLKFGDGRTDALMVDNAEWLAPLNYIEFLRDVGRHFSVNRMLTMDSAKLRLDREQELSFIEFNYMLLQAYDYRRAGAPLRLQSADGRLRPVGQHRHRHRSRPPHGPQGTAIGVDLSAADDRIRRQDGQDRGRRRLAQRANSSPPTTTGSSGATPRTPTCLAS